MSLINHLNTLESAGLLRVAQYLPELEYLFRHTLVQEAAYASLLNNDRQRLHHAVGKAVERLYFDRLDEMAPTLARHFELAGDQEDAIRYFIKAGESTLAHYANPEAEAHFRKALALTSQSPQRQAHILTHLGEALFRQGRNKEAVHAWKSAIEKYIALDKLDLAANLYARAARAIWYEGDIPGSLVFCQEGAVKTLNAPDSHGKANLIHELARAYHFNGKPEEAKAYLEDALALAERLGAVDVQADALTTFGVLKDIPEAESTAALEKAVELAEAQNLLQIAVRANHNLGVVSLEKGMIKKAQAHYQRAVELARMRGASAEELFSRMNLASLYINRGDLAALEAELDSMERLSRSLAKSDQSRSKLGFLHHFLKFLKGDWLPALEAMKAEFQEYQEKGDFEIAGEIGSETAWILIELHRIGIYSDLDLAYTFSQAALKISEQGFSHRLDPLSTLCLIHVYRGELEKAKEYLAQCQSLELMENKYFAKVTLTLAECAVASAEKRYNYAIQGLRTTLDSLIQIDQRLAANRIRSLLADTYLSRGESDDVEQAEKLIQETLVEYTQIGATLYLEGLEKQLLSIRSKAFAQAKDTRRMLEEMASAGRIQEGLLPKTLPELPGWQFAALLDPARQTSGDFYEFIQLPDGRLGIAIADVADKGAGAALFMAMTHSLLRTYAGSYPEQPDSVIAEINRRMLADTSVALFVTVFYGILEPTSGKLVYCNAGHNPPCLLRSNASRQELLSRTGIALGIFEEAAWEARTITLEPGDLLVMYTDGVVDAQNPAGDQYGDEKLQGIIDETRLLPAGELLGILAEDIHKHTGAAEQTDDITIVVLRRNS